MAIFNLKKPEYRELFLKAIADSSYSVAGSGLAALGNIDSTAALDIARTLSKQKLRARLSRSVNTILYTYAGESDFDALSAQFEKLPFGNSKFSILQPFAGYLKRIKDDGKFRRGIDMIINFRDSIPPEYGQQLFGYINGMILNGIASAKQSAGLTGQADYIKAKLAPKTDTVPVAFVIPPDVLQKYAGEYTYNSSVYKVSLKNEKTLFITFPDQPEMELVPTSKTGFTIKFMDDYKVEFNLSDKGEVSAMTISVSGQEVKMDRKR